MEVGYRESGCLMERKKVSLGDQYVKKAEIDFRALFAFEKEWGVMTLFPVIFGEDMIQFLLVSNW